MPLGKNTSWPLIWILYERRRLSIHITQTCPRWTFHKLYSYHYPGGNLSLIRSSDLSLEITSLCEGSMGGDKDQDTRISLQNQKRLNCSRLFLPLFYFAYLSPDQQNKQHGDRMYNDCSHADCILTFSDLARFRCEEENDQKRKEGEKNPWGISCRFALQLSGNQQQASSLPENCHPVVTKGKERDWGINSSQHLSTSVHPPPTTWRSTSFTSPFH